MFTSSLIIPYAIFFFFLLMQVQHSQNFEGQSQGFEFILVIFAAIGTLTNVGLLVYFGYQTHWWAALQLLGIGIIPAVLISQLLRLPVWLFSLAGFLIIPISAWYTWQSMASL
jgi:hypothetical protein